MQTENVAWFGTEKDNEKAKLQLKEFASRLKAATDKMADAAKQ